MELKAITGLQSKEIKTEVLKEKNGSPNAGFDEWDTWFKELLGTIRKCW